jgi:hypothetical protein
VTADNPRNHVSDGELLFAPKLYQYYTIYIP